MNKRDFLDQIIEERKTQDAEFAETWPIAEVLLEVARIRKAAGLTQAKIAERMGVPQPRVAEIERDPSRVSFGRILAYIHAAGATLQVEAATKPTRTTKAA